MKLYLYAIVDHNAIPIPDTCLCSHHYTPININWYNLSYDEKSIWLEYEPFDNEYNLSCVVCGYPIDVAAPPVV